MSIFKPNVKKMKKKDDVEGLIKALDYQKDNSVREAAARALGEIGNERAVEPLIAILKDDDKDVREVAAEALVKIGAPAVEPLVATLKDADASVRQIAARALGQIGGQLEDAAIRAQAMEPLIAVLGDADVCRAAARALGQIGGQPEDAAIRAQAMELLIAVLKDMDITAGKYTPLSPVSINPPEIMEPLIATLDDEYEDVRWPVAKALKTITEQDFGPTSKEDELARLVAELISIGRRGDYLSTRSGGAFDENCRNIRVREIGTRLDELGGFELMQQTNYLIRKKFVPPSTARRELEFAWDGIGRWRG